jgi:hypothetical protein
MMVIIQLSGRYFIGLLTGCLLLTAGLMSLFLNGPPSWWIFTPGAHLTYIGLFPLRSIPIIYSILYWTVGITLAFAAGRMISRRQNHLAAQEQEEG